MAKLEPLDLKTLDRSVLETMLTESMAIIQSVDDLVEGRDISDFMESFPTLSALKERLNTGESVALQIGPLAGDEFIAVTARFGNVQGLGDSRKRNKAIAYALESLASQLKVLP